MSTFEPHDKPREISTWAILAIVLGLFAGLAILVILVMGALLLPAIQAAREAARRSACVNNLRQVGMALQSYHDKYKSFPPAVTADAEGKPLHSWRVLILPYLGDPQAAQIYADYHFDEPWNSPANLALAAQAPSALRCPSGDSLHEAAYLAVVGPETAWPGTGAMTVREIAEADGTSNTIMVVESVDSKIHWMEPRDLSLAEAERGINAGGAAGISSPHFGGANALYADGSVQYLPEDTPPEKLRAVAHRQRRRGHTTTGVGP